MQWSTHESDSEVDKMRPHVKILDEFLKKHESRIKDLRFMAHLFRKSLLSMIGLILILILVFVAGRLGMIFLFLDLDISTMGLVEGHMLFIRHRDLNLFIDNTILHS